MNAQEESEEESVRIDSTELKAYKLWESSLNLTGLLKKVDNGEMTQDQVLKAVQLAWA